MKIINLSNFPYEIIQKSISEWLIVCSYILVGLVQTNNSRPIRHNYRMFLDWEYQVIFRQHKKYVLTRDGDNTYWIVRR